MNPNPPVKCSYTRLVDPKQLQPHPKNNNEHPQQQIAYYAAIIEFSGWRTPIRVSKRSGLITKGHGALLTALAKGWTEVPVEDQPYDSEAEELSDLAADNNLARMSQINPEKTVAIQERLKELGADQKLAGFAETSMTQLSGDAGAAGANAGDAKKLADRFLVPPFSVLDARQGYWQERKRAWLSLGIRSEVGRGANLLGMSDTVLEPDPEKRQPKRALGAIPSDLAGGIPNYYLKKNAGMSDEQILAEHLASKSTSGNGTSIFDPVLCELAYRWFSPKGGSVIDPFAGGSVRGVVASHVGLKYHGIELREEQVVANRAQLEICKAPHPEWQQGDSSEVLPAMPTGVFDLLFSCPPYFDLEVYSDDPKDISRMEWEDFLAVYRAIIQSAAARLKENRFAVWVVGEVRDKSTGAYRNFIGETVRAFQDAGLSFYNEAILVTSVGTLPIRAARMFTGSRVLGKTHQNVLVFVKGDRLKATEACGEVELDESLFLAAPAPAAESCP